MSKARENETERPAVAKKPSREEEARRIIREYIDDQVEIIETLRRWLN